MSRKKTKVRVYKDSERKENRTPSTVGPDAYLELSANGIRGLLNMGISKEAYNLILSNVVSKPKDDLARFRVNAVDKVKNAEYLQRENIKNSTQSELKMKLILTEMGVKYEYQKIYFVGYSFYIVDFYIPEYNIVIEIDGQQHSTHDAKIYDKLRTENLVNLHKVLRVVRFDNKDLTVDSFVINRLKNEFQIK